MPAQLSPQYIEFMDWVAAPLQANHFQTIAKSIDALLIPPIDSDIIEDLILRATSIGYYNAVLALIDVAIKKGVNFDLNRWHNINDARQKKYALHYAIQHDLKKLVFVFLKYGAYIDDLVLQEIYKGDHNLIWTILEHLNEGNNKITRIVNLAKIVLSFIEKNDAQSTKKLLCNSKVAINLNGHNAAHITTYNGNIEILQSLIQQKIDLAELDPYEHTVSDIVIWKLKANKDLLLSCFNNLYPDKEPAHLHKQLAYNHFNLKDIDSKSVLAWKRIFDNEHCSTKDLQTLFRTHYRGFSIFASYSENVQKLIDTSLTLKNTLIEKLSFIIDALIQAVNSSKIDPILVHMLVFALQETTYATCNEMWENVLATQNLTDNDMESLSPLIPRPYLQEELNNENDALNLA